MRGLAILTAALLLTLGLAACDGDETVVDSVVRLDSTETLVTGTVILRPWTDFHLNMMKLHNEVIAIDSVTFADSLCRMGYGAFRVWGDDYYLGAYYYAPDEPVRFGSGDTASVTIFGDHGPTAFDVKLLALPDDSVTLVASASDSQVAVGEAVDLVWNRVPNADWYGITYALWFDSGGHSYVVYDGSLATTDYDRRTARRHQDRRLRRQPRGLHRTHPRHRGTQCRRQRSRRIRLQPERQHIRQGDRWPTRRTA